jgi:hypothetical protein
MPHLSADSITNNSVALKWTDLVSAGNNHHVRNWYIYGDENSQKLIYPGSFSLSDFGPAPGYGRTVLPASTHTFQANNLKPCTVYHFGLIMDVTIDPPYNYLGVPETHLGGGQDVLNFVTAKTTGCSTSAAITPAGTQGSNNTAVDSNSPDSAHRSSYTQLAEGNAVDGILLEGVTTISQHEKDQQHRRNLALTVILAVVAIALAAFVVNKYIRKKA